MRKHQKKCHRRISAAVIFLCIGAITLAMIGSSSGTAITLEQSEQQETQETIISHSGSGVSEEKMISVTRSDGTVDTLTLEDYLIGVLSAEVSPQFYEEALKAQAIAARTYTESKLQEGQPLCDDYRCCQAYYDESQRRERWNERFDENEARLREAVTATSGMVLCYDGQLQRLFSILLAVGRLPLQKRLGNSYPYLVSVDCSWDTMHPVIRNGGTFCCRGKRLLE